MATTSLYRAIRSLLDGALITEAPLEEGEDQRRRRYRSPQCVRESPA